MKTAMQSTTIVGNAAILAAAVAGVYFGVIPPTAGYAMGGGAAFNIYQRFKTDTGIVSAAVKEKLRLKEALMELGIFGRPTLVEDNKK